MATMKAAVCKDRETIVIEDVPRPEPKPDEVLVEVKATGLCGSDVDGYTGHHPMIQWPIILGHECSGIVAEIGAAVRDWQPGDEVVIEPFFNCKECPACLRGEYNLCIDLKITGHQVDGSLADYVIADPFFLHPKPDNLPWAEAAIAEPVSGSLHAVERVAPRLGDFTVILGCGTIGVLAMQHCLNKGAEVLVSEPEAFKRKVATQLGVHHTVDPTSEDLKAKVQELTGGIGADVVIEACGKPETLAATVGLARRGGRIMLIGWSGNETDPIDLTSVTLDELTVMGTLGFAWDHKTALKLMSMGKVKVAPIISHHLPLDRVEEGIHMLHDHAPGVWKIAIEQG